jgi:hypothetical protein
MKLLFVTQSNSNPELPTLCPFCSYLKFLREGSEHDLKLPKWDFRFSRWTAWKCQLSGYWVVQCGCRSGMFQRCVLPHRRDGGWKRLWNVGSTSARLQDTIYQTAVNFRSVEFSTCCYTIKRRQETDDIWIPGTCERLGLSTHLLKRTVFWEMAKAFMRKTNMNWTNEYVTYFEMSYILSILTSFCKQLTN